MKPAVSSKKTALLPAILVGGFALYWYFVPFVWLGIIMAIIFGGFTFYILNTKRMERLRRPFFIALFASVFITLIIVIFDTGISSFLRWVDLHEPEYYLPGQSVGALSYPCTRQIPQVLLGRADFMVGHGKWVTTFPSSLEQFLVLLAPFVLTGIMFARGFCGWICPLGGLPEAFVTGKKERWKLTLFKKRTTTKRGFRYEGLKEWVKDTKYGLLLAIILLSIFFSFPLVCIFCPVLWLESFTIFVVIMTTIFVFAIVLPFMTKRRWWCLICPAGAAFSLLQKISLFRV
ncbi:MAG: 4Fe-4S binding protein, partial [Candidatus Thorarchaeota archaeon]